MAVGIKLTLYVDESGDFETARGEWVVAGLLCRADQQDADLVLAKFFNDQAEAGLSPALADCHLTEIRSNCGIEHANVIRDRIFAGLFSSCHCLSPILVGAVNEGKRRVDEPERTYRTMLLDLLGLVESSLTERGAINSFDVVIATRTRDGLRLTTLEQLDRQVRDTLPGQLEVGLASRGLWHSFETNALRLRLLPAAKSWGLVIADFIANTLYNHTRPEQALYIETLKGHGRLSVFESFGSYEERRARVAERDGDRVSAIGRWASIEGKSSRVDLARKEALGRLWLDLLKLTGTTGPFASLESVLEWLMRRGLGTRALVDAVDRIEDALTRISVSESGALCDRLLYRVRNFRLRNINHLGRCAEADRVIALQLAALERLQDWPEVLPNVLEFGAITIEAAINKLDFATASSRASEHLQRVKEYLAVWELFTNRPNRGSTSRWYVRAASAFVRARTLAMNPVEQHGDADFSSIFAELEGMALHPRGRIRLRCYRILSLLRIGRVQDALVKAEEMLSPDLNDFALTWISRTVGDASFAGIETPLAAPVLEELRQRTQSISTDHPADLLWRERGVLEHFVARDRNACRRCLDRSLEILANQDLDAPIGSWLVGLVLLHRDVLLGSLASVESYFTGPFANECLSLLDGNSAAEADFDLALTIRRHSPY